MSYYVAVHGGAGHHSSEDEKKVRKALRRACSRALKHLQAGASACIAVKESITELEDSEQLNAGYGSNLTSKGSVECDAAIMDGSGHFGSVGALAGVRNPICAAKAILDQSRVKDPMGRVAPLTLVSTGAHDFSFSCGIPTVDPSVMISPRAQSEWEYWVQQTRLAELLPSNPPGHKDKMHDIQDTVGSVALDVSHALAAGVSSGGLLLKPPGRVGEAAVFGAGCWAQFSNNNTNVACSASGTGEAIIQASIARKLSDALALSPDDPHEEIRRILTDGIRKWTTQIENPQVGVIILTKDQRGEGTSLPRLWCAFNTATMAISFASSHHPNPKSMILRQSTPKPDVSAGEQSLYLTVLPWTDD